MKPHETELKFIGYYQLISGIAGILIFFWILKSAQFGFLFFMLIAPFFLSLYAGYLCLYKQQHKFFISKLNQALQVIGISIAGFSFNYNCGIFFELGIDMTEEFLIISSLGISEFEFLFDSTIDQGHVMVNIIAFYLVYRLIKLENKFLELE